MSASPKLFTVLPSIVTKGFSRMNRSYSSFVSKSDSSATYLQSRDR